MSVFYMQKQISLIKIISIISISQFVTQLFVCWVSTLLSVLWSFKVHLTQPQKKNTHYAPNSLVFAIIWSIWQRRQAMRRREWFLSTEVSALMKGTFCQIRNCSLSSPGWSWTPKLSNWFQVWVRAWYDLSHLMIDGKKSPGVGVWL